MDKKKKQTLPGIYRAIVVDNRDPQNRGRVRVRVPQVNGAAVSNWAWPVEPPDSYADCDHSFNTGATAVGDHGTHTHTVDIDHVEDQTMVRVPKPGQGVWVMFEAGDPNYPVWIGTYGVKATRWDAS